MNEFYMTNANIDSMDPTVLQPMMRSALIKYSRQGDLDAVRDLLEAGVDPDTRLIEAPRRTLLQEAARTGRTALAELLVANGASIAVKDEDGFNSLYHAYNSGHGALAERLVSTQAKSARRRK
jgi:ankyrin repeat protein